jgi:hypothetical protein
MGITLIDQILYIWVQHNVGDLALRIELRSPAAGRRSYESPKYGREM